MFAMIRNPNWWMVALTSVYVLVAILQLVVFGIQARRLRQTIAKMDEIAGGQTADMQASIAQASRAAEAMERVANDMAVSATAARDSVDVLRERTAQQMRAYLTVIIGQALYQERAKNIKFEGKPMLVNTGHTPARKVAYKARAAILPYEMLRDFAFPLPAEVTGASVMGPQQSALLSAIVADFVPDNEVPIIKSGAAKRALHVWGTVYYEDIFGENHETKFCQILTWQPDGKIFGYFAPGHNDAT